MSPGVQWTILPTIDVHQHLVQYEVLEPGYRSYLTDLRDDYFGSFQQKYSRPEEIDAMLAEAGIELGVVMSEDTPLTTGMASSDYVSAFCRRTTRLKCFASINPMTVRDTPGRLEHDILELGCIGLKLYPSYQSFYPNDPAVYKLYEKAVDLRIPVTFHTGSSVFIGSRIKYAEPIHLDDVAVDFPELTILMAHGGRPFWYGQAAWLVRRHPNVYIDLAGLPPRKLPEYFPDLERLAPKLLFGSDWPAIPRGLIDNIAGINALPLPEEAKRAILHDNAVRVLKLPAAK